MLLSIYLFVGLGVAGAGDILLSDKTLKGTPYTKFARVTGFILIFLFWPSFVTGLIVLAIAAVADK